MLAADAPETATPPPPGPPTSPLRRPSPAPDPRPAGAPGPPRPGPNCTHCSHPARAERHAEGQRVRAFLGTRRATADRTAGPAPKLLTWGRGEEPRQSRSEPKRILKPSLRPRREHGARSLQGWEAEGTGREQKARRWPARQVPPVQARGAHARFAALPSPLCCFLNKGWCQLYGWSSGQAPVGATEAGRKLQHEL